MKRGIYFRTLVVKREGYPTVGKEGDPIVVFQTGRVGDFD